MLCNNLSYFNLGDDKASQSDSEPVQTDKIADGTGKEILSFEHILFQTMAYCVLF
jgi:hypothetical protein